MERLNKNPEAENTLQDSDSESLALLERIWDLRLAGFVEEAFEEYASYLAEIGGENALPRQPLYLQKQLQLLAISFFRNRRQPIELQTAVQKLEAWRTQYDQRACSQTSLQLGLNELAAANPSKALENFIAAKRFAKSPREQHLAWFNSLLCMEDLGLAYYNHLEQFLQSFQAHEKQLWARSILEQLDALQIRSAFKRADWQRLESLCAQSQHRAEQGHYHAAWIQALPYAPLKNPQLEQAFSSWIAQHGFSYLSQYRLRTLSGLLVEQDCVASVRLGEKVERLYLWVWRWLLEPKLDLLKKILHLKKDLEQNKLHTLSSEEFQLLENAYLWLGLWSGAHLVEIQSSLSAFSRASGRKAPHLEAEYAAIQLLLAEREENIFAADTRQSTLSDPNFRYNPWLLQLLQSQGPALLENSVKSFSPFPKGAECVVDVQQGTVSFFTQGYWEKTEAPALAALLSCFENSESCEKSKIAQKVYGIRIYDNFLHQPKIANLLSKANKKLEKLASFSSRGEAVFAQLQRSKIHFRGSNAHSKLFSNSPELKNLFSSANSPNKSQDFSQFEEAQFLRLDLENALQISKATSARLLQQTKKLGLVKAEGNGKNQRYQSLKGFAKFLESYAKKRTPEGTNYV